MRGPVHFTQLYGVAVGVLLLPILWWAFRRSPKPAFVFWQFVLWYSVLRATIEEPFRDNPLAARAFVSEGIGGAGVGLFTLTQLASVVLIVIAAIMLRKVRDAPEVRPAHATPPVAGVPGQRVSG